MEFPNTKKVIAVTEEETGIIALENSVTAEPIEVEAKEIKITSYSEEKFEN